MNGHPMHGTGMSTAHEPRRVLLAAPRSTYLVGPVSGPQLAAAIGALVVPVILAITGVPGWGWLAVLTWQVAVITAVRHRGRSGWRLLALAARTHRRHAPTRSSWHPPSDAGEIRAKDLVVRGAATKPRPLLAAAPGRLARAHVLSTHAGDVFLLPAPGGATRAGRATVAWTVTGPPYALLTVPDQDAAISRWAAAINRLAALPGIVGVAVHERSASATGLAAARAWSTAHASSAVPVAAAEYAALLDGVDARDPSSTLTVTFDPRKVPGKAAGPGELIAEVPGILTAAGITIHARVTAVDAITALLDIARPLATPPLPPVGDGVRPVFPAYTEDGDLMHLEGVCHAAVVAVTATAVAVGGDVLAPILSARAGVEQAVAITARPLPTEQTQARARARSVKLRRQRAAAETSSVSGMLIDTHRITQEMDVLDALGADAVRGSVETELVITVVLSGSDPARVRAARDGLIRDAAPLRFTTLPWPAPTVAFTRAPLGGLL